MTLLLMNQNNESPVKTTCPYCGVGCGVLVSIGEQGAVSVKGDPDHPANEGRLCSKGTALGETAYLQDRLLYPEICGEQVSWEQALSTVAGRFDEIIDKHGADAVAFYVSGQLLTEDYYVANKLMKGFIGSANIDTNSRLCMSSAVAAYKRAFGEDCVPCSYEDLDKAELIVLTGSNAAWCHPVLFQRIVRAKKANPNMRVVNIDPRETQTSSVADLQLSLKPGSDAILFNGLLAFLAENDAENSLFTRNCTTGLEGALEAAKASAESMEIVAEECGLAVTDVEQFYTWFSRTERTITVFSQGINQSSSGTDKGNAIINCHLFTGRVGRPGMGPFSFTGQPNAMGGREVGGLANQLAAHLEINNPQHQELVQTFWESPVIADKEGLKAVDLFDAIETGKVKAVWIMATNPVVSLPDASRVKAALKACELVVISDCVKSTDTADVADVLLPATTWGERNGTVTNTDRTISRQRPFLSPPGQARADWQIITDVAQHMGFAEAFPYQHAEEIFREHAQLSAYKNDSEGQVRQFNIQALSKLSADEYDHFKPIAWPITERALQGSARLFADGVFSTPDGKARFIPIKPRLPKYAPTEAFPLRLNTGRVRDHWHTMTRTGVSPRLSTHTIEPYAEVHELDAARFQLKDGSLARLRSPLDTSIVVRVKISDKQQQGSLFVPMHWNEQFSNAGGVGRLIQAVTDPVSGQPESKQGIVAIEPCNYAWHGFVLSATQQKMQLQYADYWVRSRGKGLWRYELAGMERPQDWAQRAHQLIGEEDGLDWIEYFDTAQNQYRAAQFKGSRLINCVFIGPNQQLPPRDWLMTLFRKEALSKHERGSLLTGKPASQQEDTGKVVCACFSVGEKTILKAIQEKGLKTTKEVGEYLQAGTNCGSCLPELSAMIEETLAKA